MVANTPGIERVRDIADQAFGHPEGIRINFWASKCGGLKSAGMQARSLQIAFCAMRAKHRRREMNQGTHRYEPSDTTFKSKYDALACSKRPMDKDAGFYVLICPATALDFSLDVVDAATNEPVRIFSGDERRMDGLLLFFDRKVKEALDKGGRLVETPWNAEDEEFAFHYNAEWAQAYYDLIGLTGPQHKVQVKVDFAKPFDLADLPEDVDPFTGEKIIPGNAELGIDGTIPTE